MGAMKKQYGSKKGKQVFYASKNKGNITMVDNTQMNWQDKVYENLTEARLIGITRGPKKEQVSRTYKRGKSESKKRTTVSVDKGKLKRKEWTAGKTKSVWKSQQPMTVKDTQRKRSGIGWNP